MATSEPILSVPTFLSLAVHHLDAGPAGETRVEVVSRDRLDTRQVIPFFVSSEGRLGGGAGGGPGEVWVGVLDRERASRRVRGAEARGLEPIGFDFRGVDETGDVRAYGRAIFSARAQVAIDEAGLVMPLPSVARSIGWATELALPLLLPVHRPEALEHEVTWDGGTHRIRFEPLEQLRERLGVKGAVQHDEVLALALAALAPARPREWTGPSVERLVEQTWDAERIAAMVQSPPAQRGRREAGLAGDQLRFLGLHRVGEVEVVTPGPGASIAVLPWVVARGEPFFLLWIEPRATALERRARQPIFDLPVHPRHVNATARYVERARLLDEPHDLAQEVLQSTFGAGLRVIAVEELGLAEPAPSFGNEVRRRLACALDPASVGTLPDDVILVSGRELARAVAAGLVRDPVIVAGLLQLGLDPFVATRSGEPRARRAFVDRMTEGSTVQRRLASYSSIEAEQLGAPTYARVMQLLQHEYGVRIAYPARQEDRSFFKAAFRVFMAASRGDENRALQGLHWSHDAFHFAIGNLTLPPPEDFPAWFDSGDKVPPAAPHDGPAFEAYCQALKAAEDEATFFSFWTLYDEQPSLVRHVPMLTFWAGLRELGVFDRATARAMYDDLSVRGVMPARLSEHPRFGEREELRKLFEYVRGFRDYHLRDIHPAFDHASRDVYRGYFARFGIYETDPARYVERVRTFDERLRAMAPGLSPLAAYGADVRMAIALRVFDLTKAMRLQRNALVAQGLPEEERRARLRAVRLAADVRVEQLIALHGRLRAVRDAIHDAELSPRNEELFAQLGALAAEVESVRDGLWTDAAALLSPEVLAAERTRELPR